MQRHRDHAASLNIKRLIGWTVYMLLWLLLIAAALVTWQLTLTDWAGV